MKTRNRRRSRLLAEMDGVTDEEPSKWRRGVASIAEKEGIREGRKIGTFLHP